MKKVLIGSCAMKYHFPDFNRTPKDVDYAVDVPTYKSGNTEYLYNPVVVEISDDEIISKEHLLTLKMSHIFWDINWEKHLYDMIFLQKKGVSYDVNLFYRLYSFWNETHKNNRSDLKMSSEDFFNNALKNEHNHDYIHTLLKEVPTYSKILKDNEEVEPCEEKFKALSYEDKCSLVQEEVMVMAWERYRKDPYLTAYYKMLKKFIIAHAPMWEALFILENFNALYKAPFNFYKIIEDGIKTNQRSAESSVQQIV